MAPVPAARAPVATAPVAMAREPEDWEVVVPQAVPLSVSLGVHGNSIRDGRARCESAWLAGVALAPWYYGAQPTAPDIPAAGKARVFLGLAPGRGLVISWKKANVKREVRGWEGCGSRDALLVLGLGSKAELNCMLDGLGGIEHLSVQELTT